MEEYARRSLPAKIRSLHYKTVLAPLPSARQGMRYAGGIRVRTPIIIDSEIGPHIDDAFSLALALCSDEVEIRGVTVVSDVDGRATAMARDLVSAYGQRLPVIQGAGTPVKEMISKEAPAAVDFIVKELSKDPGKIVIITNGPLTNVAL